VSVTYRTLVDYLPELAHVVVDVVDIGANPIDGHPPYKPLLQRGGARVIGFEPAAEAYAELEKAKGPHETYLPLAVGDGREHTLHLCAASGMTSLLEPNPDLLRHFHGFEVWARVDRTERIRTTRLDDVEAIRNIDFLKIDIQGFELEVFKHGEQKLSDAVVIQTEVEFLPLYKNQPLFTDVDSYLASRGFVLHRFWPLKSRTVRPMLVNGDIFQALGQVFDADAVYIRDFRRLDGLGEAKLEALAVVLNDLYGSFDIAFLALEALDRRRGTKLAAKYLAGLDATPGGARFTLSRPVE